MRINVVFLYTCLCLHYCFDVFTIILQLRCVGVCMYTVVVTSRLLMQVWPQWKVVFPDFLHADMEALWTKWLTDFRRDEVPFDALWLVSAV